MINIDSFNDARNNYSYQSGAYGSHVAAYGKDYKVLLELSKLTQLE